MMKIWERYFLGEFFKVLFTFLITFYGLYVLIDYSSHSASFHRHHSQFNWLEFFRYYGSEFVKRSDILVPFGLLIATVRTLTNLNAHNELVAMMASGVSLKRLMRPFLLVGIAFTCLLYLSSEWIQPRAMTSLKHIDDKHKAAKKQKNQIISVGQVGLEDGSQVLYQKYDSAEQLFVDAYWIRSIHDIYHMETLNPHAEQPIGYHVDHFKRDASGSLTIDQTKEEWTLPLMSFNKQRLMETLSTVDELALTDLWQKLPNEIVCEKDARAQTLFYRKLALPWLCLLAIFGAAPMCVFFTRQLPIFFIYAISIFGLVGVYLLMDAATVLGERQVVAPWLAIGVPFSVFMTIILVQYLRTR